MFVGILYYLGVLVPRTAKNLSPPRKIDDPAVSVKGLIGSVFDFKVANGGLMPSLCRGICST